MIQERESKKLNSMLGRISLRIKTKNFEGNQGLRTWRLIL